MIYHFLLVIVAHISDLVPERGERVTTLGGTRAGKSAFQEWCIREIQHTRPLSMQLLLDTKPRYRAETERGRFRKGRKSAAWRYETWSAGPTIPNSVAIDIWDEHPFKDIWTRSGEVAIMQGAEFEDWRRMLALTRGFVNAHIKGRERRIIVDEALDFYQRNTFGIDAKNDIFYRAARAGGERGIGLDMGAHRAHGLPPLILHMTSRFNLFHLRDDKDMRYLQDCGIRDAASPEGNYIFRQYRIEPGGTVSEPFTGTLNLPDSYLAQLSES
jgi:hypothetical protein